MKIIAHRGYWKDQSEKNSVIAFQRAIDMGLGIETDIRDYLGKLVIAHDIPRDETELLLWDDFLTMFSNNIDENALLAINIKSDGLHEKIKLSLAGYKINYFTFDMSMPQLYFGYRKSELRFFTSVNEFVKTPIAYEESNGIWMDSYTEKWYSAADINQYIEHGKEVCVVSPELHAREHMALWEMINEAGIADHPLISICTDLPIEADKFFNRQRRV